MSNRGGAREGAGRRKGSGQYGEETKAIRVPLSRVSEITTLIQHQKESYACPLYASKVQAGFPSPADDYIESTLDLNEHLIKHPAATFFVRAIGDSMKDAGIATGDMLIVDRSIEASHGKIVIAALNGELTVKRLSIKNGLIQLLPDNKDYPPIDITTLHELLIWGVVTYVIHAAE